MAFQDNLLQDKNLTGLMETVLGQKNLMLMVISLKLALVKKISIRKLSNLGFNHKIMKILHQYLILWASLSIKEFEN